MAVRKGENVELTIDAMAPGGNGVARVDGFVLFVRGGIPGDTVRARVYRKKKDYAEARVMEIIRSSPDRIDPPCPYFGHCGGCQWQHIPYERQLEFKEQFVREALERIGGFGGIPVHSTLPSSRLYAYRNKMEFSFSDRRWLLPDELGREDVSKGFALGLHVPGTFEKIIDIDRCLLQPETGNRILQEVKHYTLESGAPPYGLKSHRGFWRFLMVRHSEALDEWMVNLVTSDYDPGILQPLADRLHQRIQGIRTIVNNINRRRAAVATGDEEHVLTGDGCLVDQIGPYRFRVSANAFFQTNPLMAECLYRVAADYGELAPTDRVLDLYSGTGTIPVFLSHRVESVTGIELSEIAVEDARRNCTENRIDNCRFLCGDIHEVLPSLGEKPDVAVIDPPRAGMHKKVLPALLELSPERIVYVSCNPATMARDLAGLKECYEVLEVQPVDMFPQTHHVEALARLRVRKR